MYLGQFQKYYIQPPPPNPNIKALQKSSHFFYYQKFIMKGTLQFYVLIQVYLPRSPFLYKRFALDTQSQRNTPEVDPAFVLMASSSSSTSTSTSTSTSKFDLPGRRNLPSFSPNGDGVHFSNFEKSDFFFVKFYELGYLQQRKNFR